MKDPIEEVLEQAQKAIEAAPALILGSGASVPYGVPGMGALSEHLTSVDIDDMSETGQRHWDFLMSLLRETDLENALNDTSLSSEVTQRIIIETWKFLVPYDLTVFNKVVFNRGLLALTRLMRHLFRSTQRKLAIVTTNYDRLAEYAADAMDTIHFHRFRFRPFEVAASPSAQAQHTKKWACRENRGGLEGPRFA